MAQCIFAFLQKVFMGAFIDPSVNNDNPILGCVQRRAVVVGTLEGGVHKFLGRTPGVVKGLARPE